MKLNPGLWPAPKGVGREPQQTHTHTGNSLENASRAQKDFLEPNKKEGKGRIRRADLGTLMYKTYRNSKRRPMNTLNEPYKMSLAQGSIGRSVESHVRLVRKTVLLCQLS